MNFVDKSQIIVYTSKNVGIYMGKNVENEKIYFELGGI
jgi:hypothetical protein